MKLSEGEVIRVGIIMRKPILRKLENIYGGLCKQRQDLAQPFDALASLLAKAFGLHWTQHGIHLYEGSNTHKFTEAGSNVNPTYSNRR